MTKKSTKYSHLPQARRRGKYRGVNIRGKYSNSVIASVSEAIQRGKYRFRTGLLCRKAPRNDKGQIHDIINTRGIIKERK